MKFADAIDVYVHDMFSQGRFTSKATEVGYRAALDRLCDDVHNRDPRYIGREDIKRTLAHWKHPNSQRTNRAILVSFFDYCLEEGWRKDNPARQTRRPRPKQPQVYRLTVSEAQAMLRAAKGPRERRAIYLGICAGLRAKELRGLQGRHFQRSGWVWVSSEIAKGSRERWVPVIADLELVVAEVRKNVADDEYLLPAQRWRDPGINREKADKREHPSSAQALYYLVKRVGKRAGIAADLHPHLLRHAFGDHIARFAGMRNAQFLLGHAGIGTTETYVGKPTLDELAASVRGFGYGPESERAFYPHARRAVNPAKATTGIEPVYAFGRDARALEALLAPLAPKVALYMKAFGG